MKIFKTSDSSDNFSTFKKFFKKNPFLSFLIVLTIFGFFVSPDSKTKTTVSNSQNIITKNNEQEIASRDIKIKLLNIKYIEGKYRYFFDIRKITTNFLLKDQ